MEIRNNPSGPNASDRIDITQSMRESIRSNTPSIPIQPKQPPAADVPVNPKRIKNARATYQRELSEQKRVREARERFHAAQAGDQLTVSPEAQELADTAIRPTPSESTDRAARVAELKADYQAGKLNVDGLIADTARRMLSSD